jgi:hypothetical protein
MMMMTMIILLIKIILAIAFWCGVCYFTQSLILGVMAMFLGVAFIMIPLFKEDFKQ